MKNKAVTSVGLAGLVGLGGCGAVVQDLARYQTNPRAAQSFDRAGLLISAGEAYIRHEQVMNAVSGNDRPLSGDVLTCKTYPGIVRNGKYGIEIDVEFSAKNALGKSLAIVALFKTTGHGILESNDGTQQYEGQAATGIAFDSDEDRKTWTAELFMPYSELGLKSPGLYPLRYDLVLQDRNGPAPYEVLDSLNNNTFDVRRDEFPKFQK